MGKHLDALKSRFQATHTALLPPTTTEAADHHTAHTVSDAPPFQQQGDGSYALPSSVVTAGGSADAYHYRKQRTRR